MLGATYQATEWKSSLLTKFVGSQYQGSNGAADGSAHQVGAYHVTDFTATREFSAPFAMAKRLDLRLGINNIFDSRYVTDNLGPAAADTSGGKDPDQFLYYFLPARTFYASFRLDW